MKKSCHICSQLRTLDFHLYELSQFCFYLDNSTTYSKKVKNNIEVYSVSSFTIGYWLKLASELHKVEINPWKFANESLAWCGTVADILDCDAENDMNYSTMLTRFIFVQNAIEETYRFIATIHDCSPDHCSNKSKNKNNTEKATTLIKNFYQSDFPFHFEHFILNFHKAFDYYQDRYKENCTNIYLYSELGNNIYGLDIVRNIRNSVLHGTFPFIDYPHSSDREDEVIFLVRLLEYSCRISAIYIQAMICKFNTGFQSNDYRNIQQEDGEEFENFIQNCTIEYGKNLHIKTDFSFSSVSF